MYAMQVPDCIVTIRDAIEHLKTSPKKDWDLVREAQQLVCAKMAYSRRNSLDSPERAFRRGMGYCHHKAMALRAILRGLGVEARAVHAMHCRFPPAQIHEYSEPERTSGHVWLIVTVGGEQRDVCPGDPANVPGKVHFQVLSPRRSYGPLMQLFGFVGSAAVNMHRDNVARRRLRRQTGG